MYETKPCIHCHSHIDVPADYKKPVECASCLMEDESHQADASTSPSEAPGYGAWISVADKTPKDERPVLVYIKGTYPATASYYNGKFWRICGANYNHDGITHWMELPEAP